MGLAPHLPPLSVGREPSPVYALRRLSQQPTRLQGFGPIR